tara:strand:+ start:24 stop:656 length:633 start_codon:yes stop_codon:yes gene_type:complete
MSYKYSKGSTVQGDIKAADDAQRDTLIDFGEDQIDFQTSGSVRLQVNNNGVSFTNKAIDLNGNEIVGGVWQLDDGIIQNPNSSYSRIFFPADDNMNETIGAVSTNYKIAPFNGSAIKMQVKTTTDFTGKTLTGSLHVGVGTTNAYSATPALSVGVNGAAANTVYTFSFQGLNGSGFNEGNIFGFSLQLSENYAGNETIHFTTAVRFNPYA